MEVNRDSKFEIKKNYHESQLGLAKEFIGVTLSLAAKVFDGGQTIRLLSTITISEAFPITSTFRKE